MAGGAPINPAALMGMLGGGGGGGPPAPGGAPPGPAAGGAPPMPGGGPPMGGMIAQVLQQLMQNPAAQKGMMNFLQGQPPTAGMPMPPSQQAGGPPMPPARAGVPPPGQGGGPPDMPPGQGGPPVDKAEAMAKNAIDTAGQTWDGVDAPTKGDVQRLQEDPSPSNIKSFDAQFGKGEAEKYLGGQEESGETEDKAETPDEEAAEYDE
jgi:hypothetical protein